jgi:GT2 family glycosyltransferase
MPRKTSLVSVVIPFLDDYGSLDACLVSLRGQTWSNLEVIVVENGSPKPIEVGASPVIVVRNPTNLGFSTAVNQGFKVARGDLLLILNSDVVLNPDYIACCVEAIDDSPRRAGVTGKLLKLDRSNIIDSTGHVLLADRTVRDRGEWESDEGQFDYIDDLFSIPATAALYRMEALRDVGQVAGELFDEDFFAYGEDVDLGWRLHLRGWNVAYTYKAKARHRRGVSKEVGRAPNYVTLLDVRNRWLRMIKNDDPRSLVRHIWLLLTWEARQMASMALKSPSILPRVIAGLIVRLPSAIKKRRRIQGNRTVDRRALDPWFAGPLK